jgi:Gpi18-like mannosyltransferase
MLKAATSSNIENIFFIIFLLMFVAGAGLEHNTRYRLMSSG